MLRWLESEFGYKPVVYSSFFGGKQEQGLLAAVESLLKQSNDCELAAIDAIAAAAHSLVIAIGMFRGKLEIEEAVELIRLEEDMQVYILIIISYLLFHLLLHFFSTNSSCLFLLLVFS